MADYVLGIIDRKGLDSIGRLALAFDVDVVPDRETLAGGLDEIAVSEITLADGGD